MNILHIQYGMPPAGNACFRLHQAMLNSGINSSIITFTPTVKRNNVYNLEEDWKYIFKRVINSLTYRYIRRKQKADSYSYSYLPKFGHVLHPLKLVKDADVIYFHWIAGGSMSISELDRIASTGKPIVMFMHDMWDFTGGCHHSFDCEQYKNGCRSCKMFKSHLNISSKQINKKREVFSKYTNIVFVSPSEWMAKCARQSYAIRNNKVLCINNLVDDKTFKHINKSFAKKILNLPQDKIIITFGCQAGTNNKFKGWEYLREAICKIKNNKIHILIYGSDSSQSTIEQVPYPITFLGPIFDETKLSLICNASDIFVSPSLAESFGLTFLENILCGTPVVGFDNTAIGEIVIHEVTGYLAKNKDVEDLANGIQFLISNRTFSPSTNYHTDYILKSHIRLISSLLNSNEELNIKS